MLHFARSSNYPRIRERCSLDPCSGFEIFVPGRQGMAPAINPVFRSANLIRRTVSPPFHRVEDQITLVSVPPFPPNQTMERTPTRRAFGVSIATTSLLGSTLALGGRRSSCSR